MNRDNLEVEQNMSVRKSSGPGAMNAGSRTDTGGQVGPVQNNADGNMVESSRAGEIHHQLVKQENGRVSQFRVITPKRQN